MADHIQVVLAQLRLGVQLADLEDYDAAASLLLPAYEQLRHRSEWADPIRHRAAEILIALYEGLDNAAEADNWRLELKELVECLQSDRHVPRDGATTE